MPLDVGGDVLEIVQRVCDRALNVATASAKSSTHGPKAGMRALFGKTVHHLPGGLGIVKDRALKLAVEKKKRKPGRSGASNWPRGSRAARAPCFDSRSSLLLSGFGVADIGGAGALLHIRRG